MLYLSGCVPKKRHLQELLVNNNVGVLVTPYSQRVVPDGWPWAVDNGCFASRWEERVWKRFLETRDNPGAALFAVVPDVVGDHRGTLDRWPTMSTFVSSLGYKPAFVLQDGASIGEIPWDGMGALFIGGSTEYKLSQAAQEIVIHAKSLGKWVHMGRVNSRRRIQLAFDWGCDSVDGTFLAFGPDVNTPKLINMMKSATSQPSLF